jgi:hypothetical protein
MCQSEYFSALFPTCPMKNAGPDLADTLLVTDGSRRRVLGIVTSSRTGLPPRLLFRQLSALSQRGTASGAHCMISAELHCFGSDAFKKSSEGRKWAKREMREMGQAQFTALAVS